MDMTPKDYKWLTETIMNVASIWSISLTCTNY